MDLGSFSGDATFGVGVCFTELLDIKLTSGMSLSSSTSIIPNHGFPEESDPAFGVLLFAYWDRVMALLLWICLQPLVIVCPLVQKYIEDTFLSLCPNCILVLLHIHSLSILSAFLVCACIATNTDIAFCLDLLVRLLDPFCFRLNFDPSGRGYIYNTSVCLRANINLSLLRIRIVDA